MSWVVTQKSKVGNIQFFLSKYSSTLNTNSNDVINSQHINSIGYANGVITYKVLVFNVALSVSLECSNDGTNFFKFKTNTHTTTTSSNTAEYFNWTIPVSFVRLNVNTSGTTNIGNINLNCTSGGGGGGASLDGNIDLSGHIIPTLDDTFDIGSSSKKIRDLFVSEDSMWIGDKHKMSIENDSISFKKRSTTTIPSVISSHADYSLSNLKSFAGIGEDDNISDIPLDKIFNYARTLSGKSNVRLNEIYAAGDDGFDKVFDVSDNSPNLIVGKNDKTIDGDSTDTEFRVWFGNINKTVTITQGGSNNNANARIKVNASGIIQDINVSNTGNNYINGSVTLTQTGGTSGTATITTSSGSITGITLSNGGTGYTDDIPQAEMIFNKTSKEISLKIDEQVVAIFAK